MIGEARGHRVLSHGGAWQGFQCNIQRFVNDKLTVVAFINLNGANPYKIVRDVAAFYNPELTPSAP